MKPLTQEHKNFLRSYFLKKNLSKSEIEVVILVLQGLINREVANRLCVAEKTIKFHLGNAYKKLNISRRSQLIWTLPLQDFVSISDKPEMPETLAASKGKNNNEEEMIPSGISTVNNMLRDDNP